jgi:hypothetical protein
MSGEITTRAALAALYGTPREAALVKELDHVSDDYAALIGAAPFAVLATVGAAGIDVSPRGDPAPVVTVLDPKTLALPDRRGNDRTDSLLNILEDPRVALLFLIPGIGETLRVQGRATISADPALLARFEMEGKAPRTVLLIAVETVYFQCRKAPVRSRLWDPEAQVARESLPSTGRMLERMSRGGIDGAAYDAEYPARMRKTIY